MVYDTSPIVYTPLERDAQTEHQADLVDARHDHKRPDRSAYRARPTPESAKPHEDVPVHSSIKDYYTSNLPSMPEDTVLHK